MHKESAIREPLILGHKTYHDITEDVCRSIEGKAPKTWYIMFGIALLIGLYGVGCILYLLGTGIGTWGLNKTVEWAWDITNFVWWVGIGHAGTLISAVLLLLRQKWRMAINRSAEAMTIFAVFMAGLFPLIHMGRLWVGYWVLPLPNQFGSLWVNFNSPLLWDVFAISTYLSVSFVFWYIGLIPDFATIRDRAKSPVAKKAYGLMSFGWSGRAKHWSRFEIVSLVLAGLATPLVFSVHSIVSFDFATSVIPGWHTTIFPPYFVAGAVFSGFAMVQTLMLVLRKGLKLEAYIHTKHIEYMNIVIMVTGSIVGVAYLTELFMSWYSGVEYEAYAFLNRATGPAMGGWTIYPPLTVFEGAISGSGMGMTVWLISMTIFIASSLIGSLNYIVTVLNLRTKGMKMTRLPLTIWTFFVTAIIGLLSFPVLVSAVVLMIMDRTLGTSFYISDVIIGGEMMEQSGGSPILYEHLFWFLGHPEVYIILLPALGLTSEIVSSNARKPIFGYRAMIGSILAIAFLSFVVWGHHMFVTGMNPFLGGVFVFTTLLIAIPSAVKVFNYITTLWKGNLRFTPAMLFSIGLVSAFITGGITGVILADSSLDIQVHDTMFVVAHFHVVMGFSAFLGMFAGVYHWFPKMYGRMMNTKLGFLHFWITMISGYGVFLPMHFVGIGGAPRRYYDYSVYESFDTNQYDMIMDLNVVISIFAIIGSVGQLIFIFNFFYSAKYGQKAVQNPWKANSLEWTTPVEHVHGNWPGELPTVYRWPYDYSKPGADEDFIPQTVPLKEGEEEH